MRKKKNTPNLDDNALFIWKKINRFTLREAACLWCNKNPELYEAKPLPKSIRDKACGILWLHASKTPEYIEQIKPRIWQRMKQPGKRRPPLKSLEVGKEHMEYILPEKLDNVILNWHTLEEFASKLEESPAFLFDQDGAPCREKEIAEPPKKLTISRLIWWLEDNRNPATSSSTDDPTGFPSFHYLKNAVDKGFLNEDQQGRINRSAFHEYLATDHGRTFAENFHQSNPVWGVASRMRYKSFQNEFAKWFESMGKKNVKISEMTYRQIRDTYQPVKDMEDKWKQGGSVNIRNITRTMNAIRDEHGWPKPKGGRPSKSKSK